MMTENPEKRMPLSQPAASRPPSSAAARGRVVSSRFDRHGCLTDAGSSASGGGLTRHPAMQVAHAVKRGNAVRPAYTAASPSSSSMRRS